MADSPALACWTARFGSADYSRAKQGKVGHGASQVPDCDSIELGGIDIDHLAGADTVLMMQRQELTPVTLRLDQRGSCRQHGHAAATSLTAAGLQHRSTGGSRVMVKRTRRTRGPRFGLEQDI